MPLPGGGKADADTRSATSKSRPGGSLPVGLGANAGYPRHRPL